LLILPILAGSGSEMADTVDSLRQLILAGMQEAPSYLDIVDESGGCGSKFKIVVVSDSFQGVVSGTDSTYPKPLN
jgi:hypothetical protein